jgi:hypothetical protein
VNAPATVRRPTNGRRPRNLAVVPAPRFHPPRTPFVIVVVAILSAGLVGLLLLNTALAQGSFRVHDLQRRTAALQDQEQQLQVAVDAANNPARLAAAARQLGLVAAQDPGFIRLSDGRILGAPKAANKPVKKVVTKQVVATPQSPPSSAPKPSAKPSAKPSTKPSAKATPHPTPSHQAHG